MKFPSIVGVHLQFIKFAPISQELAKLIKFEQIVNESKYIGFVLIFLVGFIVRSVPLIIMGFPTEIPFNGGGLYYHFSETILDNNFKYPLNISYYTDDGVPFAYSPLLFFLIALIAKFTPISSFILHIYLPTIMSITTVIAFYFLAKEILHEKNLILFSTLIYAIFPTAFEELIPGEGLVESFGALAYIIGMIFMYKMYIMDNPKYTFITGVIFGIVILGSPGGAFAFAISSIIFLFFLYKGKRVSNAKKFISINIIAAIISSPWWLTVINNHGIGIIINGFLSKHTNFFVSAIPKLLSPNISDLFWASFCLIGFFYCIIKRDFFLPIWLISVKVPGEIGYIIPIPVAFLVTLGLFKVVIPGFKRELPKKDIISHLVIIIFVLLIISHGVARALQSSTHLQNKDIGIVITSEKNDIEAMQWVKLNTKEDSKFLLIGDQEIWWVGDWFPALTHRVTLNVGYGSEWKGAIPEFRKMQRDVDNSMEGNQLIEVSNKYGIRPTHIYISKTHSNDYLRRNLKSSDRFYLLFENEGAVIYAIK